MVCGSRAGLAIPNCEEQVAVIYEIAACCKVG